MGLQVKKLDNVKFWNDQSQESTNLLDNIRIETEASNDITLWNGVPREHIDNRLVRISKKAKNVMQSATSDTKLWKIGKIKLIK